MVGGMSSDLWNRHPALGGDDADVIGAAAAAALPDGTVITTGSDGRTGCSCYRVGLKFNQ